MEATANSEGKLEEAAMSQWDKLWQINDVVLSYQML
jgi:hypothetical protein